MLALLPLPFIRNGRMVDGVWAAWPKGCHSCVSGECRKFAGDGFGLCCSGYNHKKLSPDLIVGGFVLANSPRINEAHRKLLRRADSRTLVSIAEVDALQRRISESLRQQQSERVEKQALEAEELVAREQYKQALLQALAPELRRSLSYLHDYKQFISQVTQNINVILEQRYHGPLEQQLKSASRAEAAIYWAAKMMEEKLKTASLLLEPARISEPASFTTFEFYKMVDKYVHIYRASFEVKNVKAVMRGESFGCVRGNSEAIAVIPHTFIDNACKYAPPGSRVEIDFEELESHIRLTVSSYGPEILPGEQDRIFDLFYRGEKARKLNEGMGFGLYLARFVARQMGTDVSVHQDAKNCRGALFWTAFSVVFNKAGI